MSDTLSPEQAAPLLGVSSRTVWRWIKEGKLPGTQRPCRTTRAAITAYVRNHQAQRAGNDQGLSDKTDRAAGLLDLLSTWENEDEALDQDGPQQQDLTGIERTSIGHDDRSPSALIDILRAELSDAREHVARLAREVGSLEAELAQARRQATGDGPKRENGHRAGVWGRVGLWLRG